jgi:uncharacterized membrane protein
MKTRVIVLLAFIASAISFAKFSPCIGFNWATPGQYIHACYSDLPSLLGNRSIGSGIWAYSGDQPVEYPVITGLVMYVTAQIAQVTTTYYLLNAAFLALLFIAVALITTRIRPQFGYLLSFSPAVIASLYINWDLWAIASMMMAIYWFDRKQYDLSAIAIGISIATKFIPVFLLPVIIYIFYRQRNLKGAVKYLAISLFTWLAINLPVALTTFDGWWYFYKLNIERVADWGSLWYALSALGLGLANLNNLSILLLLVCIAALGIFLFALDYIPSLAQIAFIVIAAVTCVSKVYSPQYVLWLAPLALIALIDKRDLPAFWIWQVGEVIYHIAIWQHLATVTGASFGLPVTGYAWLSLLRLTATAVLVAALVRRALLLRASDRPDSQGKLADFLFEAGKSYP